MPSDTIIVTGGDAAYYPLLDELRQSVDAAAILPRPDFGVIDAGLSAEQVASLRAAGALVVRLPELPFVRSSVLADRPALAANLGKLWLDRLFPGHATLIWLDADTWVQDGLAIKLLRGAARTRALAVVPGSGRYWERQIEVRWLLGGIGGLCQMRTFLFKNGRHAGLPLRLLRDMGGRALLNAGVYALAADAPHWEVMRSWQERILRRGAKPFTSDQVAMALAIYADGLPVELLPDTCNYIRPWRVDLDVPALVEFYYPYPRIGIVHLAGQKQVRFDPDATVEVPDLDGATHALSLRFGHFQRMASAVASAACHASEEPVGR